MAIRLPQAEPREDSHHGARVSVVSAASGAFPEDVNGGSLTIYHDDWTYNAD
jgi:hypothetical protein